MKAQRRHELQHNVLDAELVKIIDFIKKHGKAILTAVLVVILAICVIWYAVSRHAERVSRPRRDYDRLKAMPVRGPEDLAVLLAGFEELADQSGNRDVAALACVDAADLCVTRRVAGEAGPDALQKAKGYYDRVLAEFSDIDAVPSRAYLGLARLAEGRGDMDAAAQNYRKVVELGDKASHVASDLAKARLAALDGLEDPVRLATTRPVVPETQPATAPAIKPASTTRPAATTTRPAATTTTKPATAPATSP